MGWQIQWRKHARVLDLLLGRVPRGSAQSGRLRVRGFLLFPNAVCTSAALGGEGGRSLDGVLAKPSERTSALESHGAEPDKAGTSISPVPEVERTGSHQQEIRDSEID